MVIGWGISCLVFGMLCIQIWTYFQRYPNDSKSYKILVVTLWVLEAVHQAFVGHVAWFYVVGHFGSLLVLLKPPVWTLSIQTVLGALVGVIVKMCFAMRVWKFSRGNYVVTGIIMGMALAQFATAVVYTVRSFGLNMAQANQIANLGTIALTLGAAMDVVTAASLSYFLHKMRTGYRKSDTLINRLIIYSVNTGLLTSVFSAAVLVSYNMMPDNLIFIAFYFVLCKLYANSCLALLNTRRFVHGKGTDREEATIPTFVMVAHTLPGPGPRSQFVPREREVQFEEDTEEQKVSVAPDSDKIPQYVETW